MMQRLRTIHVLTFLLFFVPGASAAAQEAVILTGVVTANAAPLRGAEIRIDALGLDVMTNAAGRYSLIIASARVRGQTVTITARYPRHRTQSADVVLRGGAMVQNFELSPAVADTVVRRPPAVGGPSTAGVPAAARIAPARAPSVDSSALGEGVASLDLPGALAGRLPGVEVQGAATAGGTSAMQIRGPRTLAGLTQPLYVVDGIVIDDANVVAPGQRAGRGGFDYGTGIGDLMLADIESVQLLRGPAAAMRYGGRAANGVILVRTRTASRIGGFVVSGSQQLVSAAPLRLPEFQNAFGQGLDGRFAFVDGRGGGINDGVSENWGPALAGQPIAQASHTEAGRPDVRFWTARPDNVRDYFSNARALQTSIAAQGATATSHARVSFGNRTIAGLTPEADLGRRSVALTAGTRPSSRLDLETTLQFHVANGSDRPGTGFDESNPAALFVNMGRQVDVAALREHLRDADSSQVSWNYAGRNNPFFAPIANSNNDRRSHVLGGLQAGLDLSSWLRATAQLGIDRTSDTRSFAVARGWMGTHPYFAGNAAPAASGATQADDVRAGSSNVDVSLRATRPLGASVVALTAGAGRRSNSLRHVVTATGWPATEPIGVFDLDGSTNIVHGGVEAWAGDHSSLTAAARHESSSLGSSSGSQLYPALLARVDLARLRPQMRASGRVDVLELHAGWARSGNEMRAAGLQQAGLSSPPAAAGASLNQAYGGAPELTTGWEVGAGAGMFGRRLGMDLTIYGEQSTNLIVPAASAPGSASRLGTVSNAGAELQVHVVPVRAGAGMEWRIDANYARNRNRVESLGDGIDRAGLGLGHGGVSLQAVAGEPMASIVGSRYLRNAAGDLLLRDGLPVADVASGDQVLGSTAPDWFGGAGTTLRFGWVEAAVHFDVRRGGRIFSVSNLVGATSGTLAETEQRPEAGLLIEGVDAETGAPNATRVSTEDYYHALGAIGERWVYDASFAKLREARLSVNVPLQRVRFFRAQSLRASLIGRNLALWSSAPNIDPETVLSTSRFRGWEMGQLPSMRSVGVQVTLTP